MRTVLPNRKRAVKPTIRTYSAYPHSHASGFQYLLPASPLIAGSRSLPTSSDATAMVLRPSGSPVPRQSFANWRAWEKPHVSDKARASLGRCVSHDDFAMQAGLEPLPPYLTIIA